MTSHELWWGALAVVGLFAALSYYTLRFFKEFRYKLRQTEDKAGDLEQKFAVISKDAASLEDKARTMLSAAAMEEALNGFIAKILQKAVVRHTRG